MCESASRERARPANRPAMGVKRGSAREAPPASAERRKSRRGIDVMAVDSWGCPAEQSSVLVCYPDPAALSNPGGSE